MTRISELSAGQSKKIRGLAHLLLTVCLLTIAGPTIALADARIQVDVEQIYDSTGSDYDAVATTGQLHPHDGEDVHDAVYDGVTYLFAGMVDPRADPSWRNAAKGGANVGSKITKQMGPRGWTREGIDEAIKSGDQIKAINKATGSSATRYVHPKTGQSVVVDNVTGDVIHVGGPGFKYGPGSGDLP